VWGGVPGIGLFFMGGPSNISRTCGLTCVRPFLKLGRFPVFGFAPTSHKCIPVPHPTSPSHNPSASPSPQHTHTQACEPGSVWPRVGPGPVLPPEPQDRGGDQGGGQGHSCHTECAVNHPVPDCATGRPAAGGLWLPGWGCGVPGVCWCVTQRSLHVIHATAMAFKQHHHTLHTWCYARTNCACIGWPQCRVVVHMLQVL
jgi:hypothetical protein